MVPDLIELCCLAKPTRWLKEKGYVVTWGDNDNDKDNFVKFQVGDTEFIFFDQKKK